MLNTCHIHFSSILHKIYEHSEAEEERICNVCVEPLNTNLFADLRL